MATLIITQAVNKEVLSKMKADDLFIVSKDSAQNIKTVDLNPIATNVLLSDITNYVQMYLQKLEIGDIDALGVSDSIFSDIPKDKLKQGIIYEVPSGLIFNNTMLASLGPKIPVRINLIGDVTSDIKTSVTDYGINNALIKVIVYVKVNLRVVMPFSSKDIKAETNVPILSRLIQGTIPDSYYGSIYQGSSVNKK